MDEQQRLEKRVMDHQRLLDQDRARKDKRPNELMEEETGDMLSLFDFWCDNCQQDFSSPCYKTKHRLYGDIIAVWRARCPDCGEEAIRHITHKDEDKYYDKSTNIRRQRNEFAWETLQADEPGFRTHYGDPFKEYNQKMQEKEKEIIERERSVGLRGMSLDTQQRLRRLLNS